MKIESEKTYDSDNSRSEYKSSKKEIRGGPATRVRDRALAEETLLRYRKGADLLDDTVCNLKYRNVLKYRHLMNIDIVSLLQTAKKKTKNADNTQRGIAYIIRGIVSG